MRVTPPTDPVHSIRHLCPASQRSGVPMTQSLGDQDRSGVDDGRTMGHTTARLAGGVRPIVIVAIASLLLVACASGVRRFGAPTAEPTIRLEVASVRSADPSGASGGGEAATLDIKDFAFAPAAITVHVGDTLTWTNRDLVAHTVTADSRIFDSGVLQNRQSFTWTFDTAGEYSYLCTIHPTMVGSVIVQG